MRFILFWLVLLFLHATIASTTGTLTVPLKISEHTLTVEIAHTPKTRAEGLMYRKSLDENSGMLFIFPEAAYYSMWMLNTSIPLSTAFLDENGMIINIAKMMPHTKTPHASADMAKYALEMNQGWFAARGITTGETIIGLDNTPVAK